MDRNQQRGDGCKSVAVALRKESVDRNILSKSAIVDLLTSLSARRAWIEIENTCFWKPCLWSLSARRAWIEMETMLPSWTRYAVALRKESVDRNTRSFPWDLMGGVALRKESVDRNFDTVQIVVVIV